MTDRDSDRNPDRDHDELVAELREIGDRLDRITVLLVALLVVQVFAVAGDLFVNLTLVALGLLFVGLVVTFLVALGKGL